MDVERIVRELSILSPEKQREVYDFIAFLSNRSKSIKPRKTATRKKLAEEPFIGLWRDREDLQDSAAWVRRIRENEWVN